MAKDAVPQEVPRQEHWVREGEKSTGRRGSEKKPHPEEEEAEKRLGAERRSLAAKHLEAGRGTRQGSAGPWRLCAVCRARQVEARVAGRALLSFLPAVPFFRLLPARSMRCCASSPKFSSCTQMVLIYYASHSRLFRKLSRFLISHTC